MKSEINNIIKNMLAGIELNVNIDCPITQNEGGIPSVLDYLIDEIRMGDKNMFAAVKRELNRLSYIEYGIFSHFPHGRYDILTEDMNALKMGYCDKVIEKLMEIDKPGDIELTRSDFIDLVDALGVCYGGKYDGLRAVMNLKDIDNEIQHYINCGRYEAQSGLIREDYERGLFIGTFNSGCSHNVSELVFDTMEESIEWNGDGTFIIHGRRVSFDDIGCEE
jgi:hypothetical protein